MSTSTVERIYTREADKRPYNLQEAGRQLRGLRLQSPFSSLRKFSKASDIDTSWLSRVEHGVLPANGKIIDQYISLSEMQEDEADEVRDRILLLSGRSPANLTPEEIAALALAVFAYKKGRKVSTTA